MKFAAGLFLCLLSSSTFAATGAGGDTGSMRKEYSRFRGVSSGDIAAMRISEYTNTLQGFKIHKILKYGNDIFWQGDRDHDVTDNDNAEALPQAQDPQLPTGTLAAFPVPYSKDGSLRIQKIAYEAKYKYQTIYLFKQNEDPTDDAYYFFTRNQISLLVGEPKSGAQIQVGDRVEILAPTANPLKTVTAISDSGIYIFDDGSSYPLDQVSKVGSYINYQTK